MKSNRLAGFALVLSTAFLVLTLGGCFTAPKAAVDVGRDLASDAKTAAYTMAANKKAAADRALKADADKAFAALKAQYDTQIETASEGTNDPLVVAQRGSQSVIDYQAGVAATRARLEAKADILYREVALWHALGDVPGALVQMHDAERELTEKAFEDFVKAGGMEAIQAVFDTLEKKYLPPALEPPPLPEADTETE